MIKALLISVTLTLSGCGLWMKSSPEIIPVVLPDLPENLLSCPSVRSVGSRINGSESIPINHIRLMWAEDRAVAVQCKRRNEAFMEFYTTVQDNLKNINDTQGE